MCNTNTSNPKKKIPKPNKTIFKPQTSHTTTPKEEYE